MVTKIDIALFGALLFGIFLVVRGAGQALQGLNPLAGVGQIGEGISEGLGNFGEQISNAIGGAGETVTETVGGAGESVGEFGENLGNQISGDVGGVFDFFGGIGDFFGNFFGSLGQPSQPMQTAVEPSLQEQLASQLENFNVQSSLGTGQQFQGGGISFIGGEVNPTPIANLSLSQIIDQFGVTASQAANIQSIAQNNFGDFDFGTNTGSGIGSVIPQSNLNELLPQPTGNVSDPAFQGLSLQQIANQLTGGNINNF